MSPSSSGGGGAPWNPGPRNPKYPIPVETDQGVRLGKGNYGTTGQWPYPPEHTPRMTRPAPPPADPGLPPGSRAGPPSPRVIPPGAGPSNRAAAAGGYLEQPEPELDHFAVGQVVGNILGRHIRNQMIEALRAAGWT